MENWLEFWELAATWTFVPLLAAIVLLVTVGTGWWKPRWPRLMWVLGLALVATSLYLGVARGEWGETLFNGQLL
ncbi:hypothetical protein [Deferrisoma camini]|uniref:hypothetical protein n=1 Tax=Deferrisoma camini TaxID=1035120 RepID=UPI00046D3726|nr:hypothetical protein [Deferrisoma camini]